MGEFWFQTFRNFWNSYWFYKSNFPMILSNLVIKFLVQTGYFIQQPLAARQIKSGILVSHTRLLHKVTVCRKIFVDKISQIIRKLHLQHSNFLMILEILWKKNVLSNIWWIDYQNGTERVRLIFLCQNKTKQKKIQNFITPSKPC